MPSEIYKFDETWKAVTQIQYMDGATPRDLTQVHYNDGGTWRQVFGFAAPETLAWDPSAPTGSFIAEFINDVAQLEFRCDTSGNFNFTFITVDASTGTPTSGMYRPGITGVDGSSYEISIDHVGITGSGNIAPIGGITLDGTFTTLSTTMGFILSNNPANTIATDSITVEIRDIVTPANTTGVAFFLARADGT